MKHLITTIVLTTSLAAGPVMANHEGSNLLNKENVGGAIGAAIGGLAGNKIVDGKGQSAATAAGAVGGWLLGRNVAHNYGGVRHGTGSHSGYSQPNPSHGTRSHSGYSQPSRSHGSYGHSQARLNSINETFVARTTSNVRAGPGTGYSITGRLHRNESVHVVGKVPNRNWYMVRNHGRQGFVYAPLLTRPHYGYRGQSDHGGYRNDSYGHNQRSGGWLR